MFSADLPALFGTKCGSFPQCDLAKGAKFIKTFFLEKRIKFELIRNVTHQMKSLRESFIPQKRATEAFHYPGYVIRLQKERQIQAKTKNLHEELCTKTMSPQSIKY